MPGFSPHQDLSGIVDDFIAYVGIERPADGNLTYSWVPGETASAFRERFENALEQVAHVLSDDWVGSPRAA